MKWTHSSINPVRVLIASFLLFTGIVTAVASAAPDTRVAAAAEAIMIKSVRLAGDGAAAELIIEASKPLTYTSYKTMSPHRLVIDFSQAVADDAVSSVQFDKGPVSKVVSKRFETEAGVLTRMEVYLNQELEPAIAPSLDKTGELRISFPGYVPVAAVAEATPKEPEQKPVQQEVKSEPPQAVQPPPPASVVKQAVITDVLVRDGAVEIVIDGEFQEYKTMRLSKPERLVIDFTDVQAGSVSRLVPLNGAAVSTARIGVSPGKVRVVLDAINGSLPDAVYERTQSGVKVSFAGGVAPAPAVVEQAAPAKASEKPADVIVEKPVVAAPTASVAARIESVDFQVVNGVSRVSIKTSGSPVVEEPSKTPGFVSVRIKNALLPRSLQRSLEAREFPSAVLRVTPVQVKTKTGHDALFRIALRAEAPAEMRREADMVYLDIKNPEEVKQAAKAQEVVTTTQKASAPDTTLPAEQLVQADAKSVAGTKKAYTGRKVTLEFADAEVRKIFQLLSEVSNKNFVLGDEVTGNISLKLVNVPWDQALDIMLETKGLDKREEGNIILVRGKGKFKSALDEEQEIRKTALRGEPLETRMFEVNYADLPGLVTQFTALKTDRGVITQDTRTNKVIVKDVKTALDDMAKILKSLDVPEKQVMIEARIVEASTTFTRSLGINWGVHTTPNAGGDRWPFINSLHSAFGGIASAAPASGVGTSEGATGDITFGTIGANVKLSMRLSAAASAGLVKIISTPKVATLNNKTAKITQGQQVPYVSATSDKVETKFVEAALALEVTPHINNNGTIIMKIDAKNDAVGESGNPPPINKKQATTELLLRDGETTVIGGIYVDSESDGEKGVPWLMDIPVLGNLFKSASTTKIKTELLIFITPRILNTQI